MATDTEIVSVSSRHVLAGEGSLVVLLPPALTSPQIWQLHQLPALVAAGYRVLAVDYEALSDSTGPDSTDLSEDLITSLADEIAHIATDICPEQFRVVGTSFGALVAQELLIRAPDRIAAAALLGTRCRTDFVRKAWALAVAEQVRARHSAGSLRAIFALLQLFSPSTLCDERIAEEWFTLLQRFEGSASSAVVRQFEASVIRDRTAALGTIRARCLVMAFGDDILTPPALCAEVSAAIPEARYVELADCGHFGFIEHPERVTAELVKFFAE